MTSYLSAGWFERDGKRGLRTEVVDGAMDAAGMLLRAGVRAELVMALGLRVRALMVVADPNMLGVGQFGPTERERIASGLTPYTDRSPALHAFVSDCLERIDNLTDLMAFYLHLSHVARMIALLDAAMHKPLAAAIAKEKARAQDKRRDAPPAKRRSPKAKSKPAARASKPATAKAKPAARNGAAARARPASSGRGKGPARGRASRAPRR
jgi:hypothetical protein